MAVRHSRWLLAAAAAGLLSVFTIGSTASAQQRTVTVQLAQQNASAVTGTATLTDMGNGTTRVDVSVTPASGDHPAHIHMGSCDNLNPAPEFPLTNVQNGTSSTVVNTSLSSIQSAQRAINLHLSAQEAATYVACGDIPLQAAGQAQGTQPPNAAPPAAAPAAPAPAAPAPAATAPGAAPVAVAPAPVQAPVQLPRALPRTGDVGDVVPLVSGLGAALIAVGLELRRRAIRR